MNTELLLRIARSAITPPSAVLATYGLAKLLIEEEILGDFVECGVYAGAHPAVMALAIMEAGQQGLREVHLFDSFQGIPMSGEKDQDWHNGDPVRRPMGPPGLAERTSSGISACPRARVEDNMTAWGIDPAILVYHEGWLHDTLLSLPNGELDEIALLRLDVDLYESTRICMEHLYPKVASRGWCVCDDYTLDGCRAAVTPYILPKDNCPIYWRKEQ